MPGKVCVLSKYDEQQLIDAIKKAEKNTSGEIRVHIEKTVEIPPIERALEVFYLLNMQHTKQQNGVLIYIASESKKVAIIGDKGIHQVTGDDFWKAEMELLIRYFKVDKFTEGLIKAIELVGEKLKLHFPYSTNDANELTDDISTN